MVDDVSWDTFSIESFAGEFVFQVYQLRCNARAAAFPYLVDDNIVLYRNPYLLLHMRHLEERNIGGRVAPV